jgi:hypothetical protein
MIKQAEQFILLTKLVDYQFKKYNAFALARIGRFYAKEAGVKMNDLLKGCFSVSNRIMTTSEPRGEGQNIAQVESWFNDGTASYEDVANYNERKNTITFTLDNGKVYETLSDGWNFISLLKHERSHKDEKGSGIYEHLTVYLKQVEDPNYRNTTSDWKEMIEGTIQNLMNSLKPGEGWSEKDIKNLDAYKKNMITKFEKAGVKLD